MRLLYFSRIGSCFVSWEALVDLRSGMETHSAEADCKGAIYWAWLLWSRKADLDRGWPNLH